MSRFFDQHIENVYNRLRGGIMLVKSKRTKKINSKENSNRKVPQQREKSKFQTSNELLTNNAVSQGQL